MLMGMEKLIHIPFADENGNGTPLSLLRAAMNEPGVNHNAATYILCAIKMLEAGSGLRDVGFDHCQLVGAERRLQELAG